MGIFIICMGPFAALYDIVAERKSRALSDPESGLQSPRPSQASEPPSYNQVMTGMKTPSATFIHNMRFSELSAKDLSSAIPPPPPSYEEVAENDNHLLNGKRNWSSDTRRMTAP